jgi:hypothetical protein
VSLRKNGRYLELAKIVDLAQLMNVSSPDGARIYRSILLAVAEARIGDRPRPIDTAPQVGTEVLLLYCPKQGGWQTGEWYSDKKRWVSNMNMETLHPTHWAYAPEEPQPNTLDGGSAAVLPG